MNIELNITELLQQRGNELFYGETSQSHQLKNIGVFRVLLKDTFNIDKNIITTHFIKDIFDIIGNRNQFYIGKNGGVRTSNEILSNKETFWFKNNIYFQDVIIINGIEYVYKFTPIKAIKNYISLYRDICIIALLDDETKETEFITFIENNKYFTVVYEMEVFKLEHSGYIHSPENQRILILNDNYFERKTKEMDYFSLKIPLLLIRNNNKITQKIIDDYTERLNNVFPNERKKRRYLKNLFNKHPHLEQHIKPLINPKNITTVAMKMMSNTMEDIYNEINGEGKRKGFIKNDMGGGFLKVYDEFCQSYNDKALNTIYPDETEKQKYLKDLSIKHPELKPPKEEEENPRVILSDDELIELFDESKPIILSKSQKRRIKLKNKLKNNKEGDSPPILFSFENVSSSLEDESEEKYDEIVCVPDVVITPDIPDVFSFENEVFEIPDIPDIIEREYTIKTKPESRLHIWIDKRVFSEISFIDRIEIYRLLNEIYSTNPEYREFMNVNNYTHINVIKSFHYDRSRAENSLHLSLKFKTNKYDDGSNVFHAYIKNNEISSLTAINQVFSR